VQSPIAARLLAENAPLWVPVTVVLELLWVLDSIAQLPPRNVLKVLRHLLGLDVLHVQHADALATAADASEKGIAIEDALHWALSAQCKTLWTFDDKGFARKAKRLGLIPECRIPGVAG
jgi:predicted nucleic-acid-binding protein